MNKHYLTIVLLPLSILISCYKETGHKVPYKEDVVTTTIAGHVNYSFRSLPVAGIPVVASARKLAYVGLNHQNEYTYFVLGRTVTDSAGNYSMTFTKDSYQCDYSIGISADALVDGETRFSAGDSTWLNNTLYKSVNVKVSVEVKHNDSTALYIYPHPDDTSSISDYLWGNSRLSFNLAYMTDTVRYLCFSYHKKGVFRTRVDTFVITSYTDTAGHYLVVDPTTF